MSPDEGSERVVRTLQNLAALDQDSYGRWFLQGRNQRDARRVEVSLDPEAVRAQLKVNRTDFGSEAIPELGFTFTAWNGGKGDLAAAFVATFSGTSPHLRNVINLDVPDHIHQLASSVLAVVRDAWQPDESDVWSPTD